jgi:hypothetical protein
MQFPKRCFLVFRIPDDGQGPEDRRFGGPQWHTFEEGIASFVPATRLRHAL